MMKYEEMDEKKRRELDEIYEKKHEELDKKYKKKYEEIDEKFRFIYFPHIRQCVYDVIHDVIDIDEFKKRCMSSIEEIIKRSIDLSFDRFSERNDISWDKGDK